MISDLGVRRQERKVRTLKGSEPANGGAFQHLGFDISDLRCWNDDKCNREKTSLMDLRIRGDG